LYGQFVTDAFKTFCTGLRIMVEIGDADSQFVTDAFKTFCTGLRIMVEIAAPKHQEMNGIVESAWRTIRLLARALMIHGRVSHAFQDFAFEHACTI
jgi:hypothetical protein